MVVRNSQSAANDSGSSSASKIASTNCHFDHLHFEVLKVQPLELKHDPRNPSRLFSSYSLACYTKNDLKQYFYDPLDFLDKRLR